MPVRKLKYPVASSYHKRVSHYMDKVYYVPVCVGCLACVVTASIASCIGSVMGTFYRSIAHHCMECENERIRREEAREMEAQRRLYESAQVSNVS